MARLPVFSPTKKMAGSILGLALAALIAGCAVKQVTFRENNAINASFETAEVLPGYQYYYSGPEAEPFAILGIRHNLDFEQGLWKKIDLTEAQLKKWLLHFDIRARSTELKYYGNILFGPNGEEIGIWYSFLRWVPARVTEEGRIIIHIPSNTIIHSLQGEHVRAVP